MSRIWDDIDPLDTVDIPNEQTYVNAIGIADVLSTYVHHVRLTVMNGQTFMGEITLRREEALHLARSIYDVLEDPPDDDGGPLSPWAEI
jgi:hypothetical protein